MSKKCLTFVQYLFTKRIERGKRVHETKEEGFLPVGQIKLDMHVLRADGTYGVVAGWK